MTEYRLIQPDDRIDFKQADAAFPFWRFHPSPSTEQLWTERSGKILHRVRHADRKQDDRSLRAIELSLWRTRYEPRAHLPPIVSTDTVSRGGRKFAISGAVS
jgi:hypothetical protein